MNAIITVLKHKAEEYWTEMLLSFIYTAGSMATILLFWSALYENGVVLGAWTVRDFVIFALVSDLAVQVGSILYSLAPSSRMIWDGSLTTFLTKPGSIARWLFPHRISPEDLVTIVAKVGILVAVGIWMGYSVSSIWAALLAIVVGTTIDVLLYTSLGFLSFFMGDSEPIQRIYDIIWGWVLDYPVDAYRGTPLFPIFTWVVPVYFITTMPTHVFTGMPEPYLLHAVIILVLWAVLARQLWEHGLRRWEAYGG